MILNLLQQHRYRIGIGVYIGFLLAYGLAMLPDITSETVDLATHLRNVGVMTVLFVYIFARYAESAESVETRHAMSLPVKVIVLAGALAGSFMALNYAVNPFGLYATTNYEPIVVNSRNQKVEIYEALPTPPDVVIMGSSRSFAVPPQYITQQTGLTAFNASVTGGVPRDFVAFTNFMIAQGHIPSTLIVGLSVDQLTLDYVPLEPDRLAEYVEGARSIPGEVVYELDNLFSLEQTEASLSVLLRENEEHKDEPLYFQFDPDGMGYFNETRALEQAVTDYLEGWRHYFDGKELNPAAMGYVKQLLDICQEHGIHLILYIAAYHPRVVEMYPPDHNYWRLQSEYLAALQAWQQDYDFTVYDLTDLDSYGGTDQLFYDASHPNEEGNRRMLDVILQGVATRHAVSLR